MTNLTDLDYKKILNYYNITIPKSKKNIHLEAKKIMAEKLCRCIKKVDIKNKSKSIGICTKNIFNRKKFTRGKFKCKGKATVTFKKYK